MFNKEVVKIWLKALPRALIIVGFLYILRHRYPELRHKFIELVVLSLLVIVGIKVYNDSFPYYYFLFFWCSIGLYLFICAWSIAVKEEMASTREELFTISNKTIIVVVVILMICGVLVSLFLQGIFEKMSIVQQQ